MQHLVSGCEKLVQKEYEETTQQCSKESPLGPLQEEWARTHGEMV